MVSGNKVISAKLSVIEVLSAMNRRQREANISAVEYTKFSGDFLSFAETEYEIIDLLDAVLVEAQRLLEIIRSEPVMPSNSRRLC